MNYKGESKQRNEALQAFKSMYAQAIGSGPVMDYLSQTGLDALRGAEILGTVTGKYSSEIEYASNSFATAMKGAAQVLQADIGTRICYTQHGSFDAHTNGIALQEGLLNDVCGGIYDFYDDMRRANKSDDVLIFVFSEFGRRVSNADRIGAIVDGGRALLDIQAKLEHGEFGGMLERVGLPRNTAYRWVKVAKTGLDADYIAREYGSVTELLKDREATSGRLADMILKLVVANEACEEHKALIAELKTELAALVAENPSIADRMPVAEERETVIARTPTR